MLARMKNGTLYGAGWLGGDFYLITRKKEKTNADFRWTGEVYRKKTNPYENKEICEVFRVLWGIIFDTGIKGAPTNWVLDGDSDISRNKIYLHGSNYEGWEFIERGWSRKEIDFRETAGQYMIKEIYVKNGKRLLMPMKEKMQMTKEEFRNAVQTYDILNN